MLLSYAEDGAFYYGTPFKKLFTKTNELLKILAKVRSHVMDRLEHPECFRENLTIEKFRSALVKAFGNTTLYVFLSDDDELQMDLFRVCVHLGCTDFPIEPVLVAYHNVRKLRAQLTKIVTTIKTDIYS